MCAMIPMFRVWEMGSERATTTECLSDAQPVLFPGVEPEEREPSGPSSDVRAGKSNAVRALVPSWKEAPTVSALPLRLGTGALIVPPYVRTLLRSSPVILLPAIVREGLVGLRHLVRIFALLDGVALVRRRVEELARELLLHRASVGAVARGADDPAHAERERAIRAHVDGNLIGRAADAAGFDLDLRLHVGERALPHLHGIVLRPLGDEIERAIDDALGDRLLARLHDRVDELRDASTRVDRLIRELRIGKRLALGNFTFAWHFFSSLNPCA